MEYPYTGYPIVDSLVADALSQLMADKYKFKWVQDQVQIVSVIEQDFRLDLYL